MKKADADYFHMLLNGIEDCRVELNHWLAPLLDRDIAQLDPITHSVLLIGLYELLHQSAIPARTVINEAVELAKMFGAEDSYKFVNGVLDKAARQLRAPELRPLTRDS
jgi:N utilization substance protein B